MGNFLIDINPDIELPKYNLVLTKLTEEPITSLKNITDLEHNAFYVGIDELNFNIPFYRTEDNGDKVENEIYSLVEGDHLILVNDMKYFIINSVVEKADESGKVWKEVHCYSREYELSKKKLIDYKADSRLLYDDTNSTLDGLEKGILNYIFNHIVKSWTIGYVDPDIILREGKGIYRSLNFSNSNLTQVFNDLQRTYGCVFKFDTIKQEMNIYSIDKMMGQHRGLYISDGNFIKNISKDINTDEIITRLYIYGKDNISIQSISPTGQPYIDNFNYYKNTLNKNGQPKYMTQGLIDALDNYYTKVENYNPDFEPLLIRLQEANAVMEDLINADHIDDLNQKGLVALERYLSNLQTLIDVKTEEIAIIKNQINKATGENLIGLYDDLRATESALDSYNTDKDNVNNLIVAKKTEINNQQQVIDGIESELKVLQDELSVLNSTNFTTEQLKELDKFIKVDIYNNSDYTENNIQELYDEGKKILNKASQPKIQFEVDVIDFLSLVECQHIWDKFTLGDIVTLEHKAIGFNYDVRLVGYEYNIDDNNLTLKFSNTDSFDDATLYLENLLDDFNTTGAVVDFNKDKWNNVGSIESRIAKMVDTKLEEARQNILNAVGQRYLFDDSGLWLYKENPDGTLNNEQIRAINNTIALTKDNWNTVGTAITPQGVVAEQIYGKLGQFAKVNAEQIEVGGWDGEHVEDNLKDYIDQQNSELNDSVEGLGDTINNAFSDNYITNIEANSLDLARNSVIKEANDVKNIATSLGVSTTTITTAINNLNTEVNKYVGKSSYPISITLTNRTNMANAFTSLESAIAQLHKSIDEKRISNVNTSLTNYIDNINDNLTGLIDGKVDTWFYAVDPTLSNPPASAWTTSAIRDKHIGDLYFNTTSGYTFRFKKVGTVYSWECIKDKDIVDAMTKASQAQDTADGKRTIFTSQPTPPYDIGDLWRVTDVEGVDFKICITARATGSFLASHWANVDKAKGYIDSQVDELDTAIGGLQTNIDNFGKDLKLTATEASTIKMDLERVTYESTDIINVATSLGITTEKDNYTAALSTLTNYLNLYWLNATYPLEITQIQIDNVTTHFKYLDDRKTKLINKISEVRTQSVTVHQIILSNENQSILTDSNGVVSTLIEVQSDIDVFRGTTKIGATIGTPVLKNKDGNTIRFGTITKANPTSVSSGNVKWSIPSNTNISSESGWIEISIIAEGVSYTKKLTWNKARAGSPGSPGSPGADGRPGSDGRDGAPAKIVTVAPSHSAFISKNMDNPNLGSSFEPQNITITPNFQNCTYSKWEYSTNGETWTRITRTTTSTTLPWINSSNRVLTVPRLWSVYSSTQTFVIFKVTSTTGEYDLITIPRLFDSTTLAENALKQNFYYNRTKITQQEGIEVYDNLGKKVLQIGGFDSIGGNGTKDKYGHVAYHYDSLGNPDGYSATVADGFVRKNQYGESYYLNDIYITEGTTSQGTDETDASSGWWDKIRILLPERFRGKNIKCFVTLKGTSSRMVRITNDAGSGGSFLDIMLRVAGSDTSASNPVPWVEVSGVVMFSRYGTDTAKMVNTLDFILIVLGS